jgi:hypothetical protein
VWGEIQTVIDTVITFIRDTVTTIWEGVKTAWETALGLISGLIDPVVTAIQGVIDAVNDIPTGIWDTIKTAWDSGLAGVKSAVDKVKDALQFVIDLAEEAWEWINKVLDLLPDLPGPQANTAGMNLASGMAQGIYDGSHWVAQAAVWTVQNALYAAQRAAGVRSPSALFAALGQDLMAGLQVGMAAQMPAIAAQVSAAVTAPALGMVSAPVLSSGATVTNNFHLGNNTFQSEQDMAVFEARVIAAVQRNMSGSGGSLF